jgi:phosphoglycerate dehydrogenase-like enzyme
MNILFDTHLAQDFPEPFESFIDRFPQHSIHLGNSEDQAYGAQNSVLDQLEQVHIYVGGPLKKHQYDQAQSLLAHFIPYTGVNRFPLDYLKNRGIHLINNHGNAPAVAERALALALAVSGRVVEFHQDLAKSSWHRKPPPEPVFDLWKSLRGARIGVMGCGAIAQEFVQLVQGFKPIITGFRKNLQKPIPPGFDVITDSLDQVLRGQDLILLALPETSDTKGILGEAQLRLAKGAILINVSRAELINESALYTSLLTGELSGAGLDVWYRYPSPYYSKEQPGNYDFAGLPQVVMSPHAASHSQEGKLGQWLETLSALEEYLLTGTCHSLVDLEAGY